MKKKSLYISAVVLLALTNLASAQSVVTDSLEMGKGIYSRPEMLLQGQISGVRVSNVDGSVSSELNTNIRGINALRGNSAPLWIIDGVALSMTVGEELNPLWQYGDNGFMSVMSQMSGFNLYDIESIEILKNTSATALYGARGANGVIIITTKTPKEGEFNLQVNSNVSLLQDANNKPGKEDGTSLGLMHNHNISLGSRMGKTNYNVSAFFRNVDGVVSNDKATAGGLRVTFDTKANNVVWFGLNSNVTVSSLSAAPGAAYYGAPSATIALRGIESLNGYDTSLGGWKSDNDDSTAMFRTTDSAFLTFNFTRWLRWKTTLGFDLQSNTRQIWYGKDTALGLENNGVASVDYTSLFSFEGKSEINMNFYVAKKNHIQANLAVDYWGDYNKFDTMTGSNFSSHGLRAKGIQLLGSETVIRKWSNEFDHLGAYAGIAYDFDGIAGFDALVRIDNNTRFQDGFNVYPAANVFFDIHKLAFADSDVVSTLRLDGGYGVAGFGRYMPYFTFGRYTGGDYVYATNDTASYYQGFNTIRSSEMNVSLKAGFLSDRYTVSLGYYDKSTSDRLDLYRFGQIKNAVTGLWVNRPRTSVGEQESVISNKGFEFDVKAGLINGKDLKLTLKANLAYNSNKLTKVDVNDAFGTAVCGSGIVVNANVEGESLSSLYGYLVNSDKVVTGTGLLGSTIPAITGGLGASLIYKRFVFDAVFDGAAGFNILNMNKMLSTKITDAASSNFVEKGDYLRLARLSASYELPVSAKWIKAVKFSLSGANLFTISGYKGYNPDVNCFGMSNLTRGIDYGSFPMYRTFLAGVTLNF